MHDRDTLTVSQLNCIRGERTLFDNVGFEIVNGQCLHVTGANGSGKTSLLKIVCGINRADQGQLQWNNETTLANPHYLANSIYVGHKDGLKNELTAIENLRFYQQLNGHVDESLLDTVLAKLQILECADLLCQQLSFGQRRRLAFARLLLDDYKLWVLDEPFTGIDIAGRKMIEQYCVDHLQQNGLLMMTHHQSLEDSILNPYRTELAL